MSQAAGQRGGRSPVQRRKTRLTNEKKIAEDEFMASAIGDVEWLRQSLRGNKGSINFDKNGLAPVHLSSIHGRLECLHLLIEKFKVDPNLPSITGWRPLHLVISNQTGKRAFNCMLYLLEKGADPSITNEDGITPMHQAASEGHVQCLKVLLEAGSRLDIEDHRGHKPIDLAKLWGHRKCARILAAEQWHQDKDWLAREMRQLQKMKAQQAMMEIEADEEMKAEQQFYGEEAFQDWLRNRGLKPKPTGPPSAQKSRANTKDSLMLGKEDSLEREKSKSFGRETSDPTGGKPSIKVAPQSESLYKANSIARDSTGLKTPEKRLEPGKAPKTPQHEPEDPQAKAVLKTSASSQGRSHTPYTRPSTESGDLGLYEKPSDGGQGDSADVNVPEHSKYLHQKSWNKSTKVSDTFSSYMSMLHDDYPRDEYTMLPKMTKKRSRVASSNASERQNSGAKSKPPHHLEKIQHGMSDLEEFKERPVVYKCKHIADIHKKKHFPDDIVTPEIGMHLTSDVQSRLFQSGLVDRQLLGFSTMGTPSTTLTCLSEWPEDEENIIAKKFGIPDVARTLHNMHKPTTFPNLKQQRQVMRV